MFKEFTTSIRSIIVDRIISPLSGVLTLVWLGYNWKAFLVVFLSDTPIESRIELVKNEFTNSYINLWYPILATLIVLIIFPFASAAAFWLWENVSAWKQNVKHKLSLDIPLSLQQSLEIRKEIEETNQKFSLFMSAKDAQIKELQTINNELSINIKEANYVKEDKSADKEYNAAGKKLPDRKLMFSAAEFQNLEKDLRARKLASSRVLLSKEKTIERELEMFLQKDASFDDDKFLLNVTKNKIQVSLFPNKGNSKTFTYAYKDDSDNIPNDEIDSIKNRLVKDVIVEKSIQKSLNPK